LFLAECQERVECKKASETRFEKNVFWNFYYFVVVWDNAYFSTKDK